MVPASEHPFAKHQLTAVDMLSGILESQSVHHLARDRVGEGSVKYKGSIIDRLGTSPIGLGLSRGGWIRAHVVSTLAVCSWRKATRRILVLLFSRANRKCRVLGNTSVEHP